MDFRASEAIKLFCDTGVGDAMKTIVEAQESDKNLSVRRNFLLGVED